MSTKDAVKNAARSFGAHQAWITRKQNSLAEVTTTLESNPCQAVIAETQEKIEDLSKQCKSMEDFILKFINEGYDVSEWDATLIEFQEGAEKVIREARQQIQEAQDGIDKKKLAERPNKIDDTLKPPVLDNSTKPVKFEQWVAKFKAFVEANRILSMDVATQRAHLNNVIDSTIQLALAEIAHQDWPLYETEDDDQQETQLYALQELFLQYHPVYKRRIGFFNHGPLEAGQSMSQYIQQLELLAESANLRNMTQEDLIVQQAIKGCTIPELRSKLTEEKTPTLNDIKDKIKTFEAWQVANSHLKQDASEQLLAVQSKKKKANFCFRCGHKLDGTHKPSQCPAKNAVCTKCGKTGHETAMHGEFRPGPKNQRPSSPESSSGQLKAIDYVHRLDIAY